MADPGATRGSRRRSATVSGVDGAHVDLLLDQAPPLTVVVVLTDGGGGVRATLESVRRHTRGHRVVVLDDTSTNTSTNTSTSTETRRLLDHAAAHDGVEVVRHATQLGRARTLAHGVELAGRDDVVLLDGGAVVGPLWTQRLRVAAHSRYSVGSVSAVTDDDGWPAHLAPDARARLVGQVVTSFATETPTAHGQCVYLRRDALDAVGPLDGEGDESDWGDRALAAGLVHLTAPRVLVGRAAGASYRPPGVRVDDAVREQALEALPRPRTLYVIHAAGGGTPLTNRSVMDGLAGEQEAFLLTASQRKVTLARWVGGTTVHVDTWKPAEPFTLRDDWRADYAAILTEWLVGWSIEVVHVHHLINQPLTTVPRVAALLGVPIVLSTHDFYYVSPTVHLLDRDLRHHERPTEVAGVDWLFPTPFTRGAPHLHDGWHAAWQRRSDVVLGLADVVVATTASAAGIHARNFPQHAAKIRVIEHGRDLADEWAPLRADRARRPGPLRVACPARWDPHKGSDYLVELVRLTGADVEFHVLGDGSEFVGDRAVVHGTYQPEALPALLDAIDPDLVGLFSVWPETYSHTLSEAWALGVPVIATDLGAVADRIRAHGGGVLFDVDDPAAAAAHLLALARDDGGVALDRRTPRDKVRRRTTMAFDYAALYGRARATTSRPLVGYVVHGSGGTYPPSTHVRLRQRFLSPPLSEEFDFRAVDVNDLVVGTDTAPYDVLVVQRDSVPPHLAHPLVERARALGLPLVLELDDDLFSPATRDRLLAHGYDRATLEVLVLLLTGATAVTVSTDELAGRARAVTDRPVHVVANELGPRLWPREDPVDPDPSYPTLLYMGSRTHHDDLELLRPVFDGLVTSDGRPVRLEVVGVTAAPGAWHASLDVPRGVGHHPRFVQWLRGQRGRWTAGVAPLVDDPFNRAKSDLKALEYARLGLAVVASDVTPYRPLGRYGVSLVDNTTREWRAAILELVEDDAQRARQRTLLAEHVHAERLIGSGRATDVLAELLRDLTT